MPATEKLVLPADVMVIPVKNLSAQVRQQIECDENDYAITRPRARTPSKVVDAEAARLIQEFKEPKTIVQAVLNYSRTIDANPEELLESAYPLFENLLSAGFLVQVGSNGADVIDATLKPGERFQDMEIAQTLQVYEDTELHVVKLEDGSHAVLKMVRPNRAAHLPYMFKQEAAILRHLDGDVGPRLFADGVFEKRPFLVMELIDGIPAVMAAESIRQAQNMQARKAMARLGWLIADAYGRLHSHGVIHSDVHPGNLMVTRDGQVKIIDYGLSRFIVASDKSIWNPPRGGLAFFFEPEFAQAMQSKRQPPPSTVRGEQYCVAALIYYLITGTHYLDFRFEQDQMLRQIANSPPRSLESMGLVKWPALETVLRKALRKKPNERFASTAIFAERLRKVYEEMEGPDIIAAPLATATRPSPGAPDAARKQHDSVDLTPAREFLNAVLEEVDPSQPLFASVLPEAPVCSVHSGAAGIAYALYRIACARDDAKLLAQSDCWVAKARREMNDPKAFYNTELGLTPELVGPISIYHTASGIHLTQALISQAMGDDSSYWACAELFAAASHEKTENLDLTLGRTSTLMGCCMLYELTPHPRLKEYGDKILQEIWSKLNEYAPIGKCREVSTLGMAHGWAGFCYAAMRWSLATGTHAPDQIKQRLREIAEFGEPAGSGMRWPWSIAPEHLGQPRNYMTGWCNGTSGYVSLWVMAHKLFGDAQYLELAEKAAWNICEVPLELTDLCCGLSGAAYALLKLYQHTNDRDWLSRAQQLTLFAIRAANALKIKRYSLYKGIMGLAVLAAEIETPESAAMPFFEREYFDLAPAHTD